MCFIWVREIATLGTALYVNEGVSDWNNRYFSWHSILISPLLWIPVRVPPLLEDDLPEELKQAHAPPEPIQQKQHSSASMPPKNKTAMKEQLELRGQETSREQYEQCRLETPKELKPPDTLGELKEPKALEIPSTTSTLRRSRRGLGGEWAAVTVVSSEGHKDPGSYQEAMRAEFNLHTENQTWKYVEAQAKQKPRSRKWVLLTKQDQGGRRWKAR